MWAVLHEKWWTIYFMAGCTDGQFNLHPWDFSWLNFDIMSLSICTLFISYSRKQRMLCLALFCRLSVLLIGFTQLDTIAFTKEHVSEYIYCLCLLRDPYVFVLKCNNDIVIEQICGSGGDRCLYDLVSVTLSRDVFTADWLCSVCLCVILKPCINWNSTKETSCWLFSNSIAEY